MPQKTIARTRNRISKPDTVPPEPDTLTDCEKGFVEELQLGLWRLEMQQNRFQVAGYLAAKPELRFLPSGTKVANARMGETYRFKGKDQKTETHTNWHRLTFYNELADLAISFEQGDNLFAEGSLQQRQFTPADGSKRTVSEIVVKSCHLIAPSRNASGTEMVTQSTDSLEPSSNENNEASETFQHKLASLIASASRIGDEVGGSRLSS